MSLRRAWRVIEGNEGACERKGIGGETDEAGEIDEVGESEGIGESDGAGGSEHVGESDGARSARSAER